jgi:hypothetical protein
MVNLRFEVGTGSISLPDLLSRHMFIRDLLSPLVGMLPSPTIVRAVSGRAIAISPKHIALSKARKPKVHLQLANCVSRPPKRGPRVGATCGLEHKRHKLTECFSECFLNLPTTEDPHVEAAFCRSSNVSNGAIADPESCFESVSHLTVAY